MILPVLADQDLVEIKGSAGTRRYRLAGPSRIEVLERRVEIYGRAVGVWLEVSSSRKAELYELCQTDEERLALDEALAELQDAQQEDPS